MQRFLITCDNCGRDITEAPPPLGGYRIVVSAEFVPPSSVISDRDYVASLVKPLDRQYDFCSLDCLREHEILGVREPVTA